MSGEMKTVDNWMLEWYASAPFNQDQMFDFIVRTQRDATAALLARVKALETGLEEIIAQCGGNQTPSLTQPRVDAHCFLSHDLMAIEHLARALLTQGEKG